MPAKTPTPELAPVLRDLDATEPGRALLLEAPAKGWSAATRLLDEIDPELPENGVLLLALEGEATEAELSEWRNAVWPALHLGAWYRTKDGRTQRRSMGGAAKLDRALERDGTVLAFARTRHVLSPDATVQKFDQNAAGWNGEPGTPGYSHFRWMRKLVGKFAEARPGQRILDFGCGAGWVGIEAAKGVPGVALRAFDPSPEMVRITGDNARAAGIADFEGRTGFGEAPPFPAAGEPKFDLVISSGVVSFSPDFEAWMRGLTGCVAPGGTLIVGDLNPRSRGMRRRRRTKPLLPVRELNGRTADEVRSWLEQHGYRHRQTAGYQLTTPVPEAMHYSAAKLGGLLNGPLLLANKTLTALDRALGAPMSGLFDSWVMHFDAP